MKRHFIIARKGMTNPDSVLKDREITLLTKVHIVRAMFFPGGSDNKELIKPEKTLMLVTTEGKIRKGLRRT